MTERKGETFVCSITKGTQERISAEKVRALLPAEKLPEVITEINMTMVKTTRFTGSKPEFQMPKLANYTIPGLIDVLGDIREKMAILKKEEGLYKEALQGRIREEEKRLVEEALKEKAAEEEAKKKGGKKK